MILSGILQKREKVSKGSLRAWQIDLSPYCRKLTISGVNFSADFAAAENYIGTNYTNQSRMFKLDIERLNICHSNYISHTWLKVLAETASLLEKLLIVGLAIENALHWWIIAQLGKWVVNAWISAYMTGSVAIFKKPQDSKKIIPCSFMQVFSPFKGAWSSSELPHKIILISHFTYFD